jgi:hypothetical protein
MFACCEGCNSPATQAYYSTAAVLANPFGLHHRFHWLSRMIVTVTCKVSPIDIVCLQLQLDLRGDTLTKAALLIIGRAQDKIFKPFKQG